MNRQQKLIAFLAAFIGVVYLAGVGFFTSHYLPRTSLATVNIAQLTPEAAVDKVQTQLPQQPVFFKEGDEELGYVELHQLGVNFDPTAALDSIMKEQSAWLWPVSFVVSHGAQDLSGQLALDTGQLEELIPAIGINNEERTPTEDATLELQADGSYQEIEETYGNQVSAASLESAIVKQLGANQSTLKLEDAYNQPQFYANGKQLEERQADLENIAQTPITLVIEGQEVPFDQEQIASWLSLDDHGQAQVDGAALAAYLENLNLDYAELNHPKPFQSTYHGVVHPNPGTYGWVIDIEAEVQALSESLVKKEAVHRDPIVIGSGYGQPDLGPNYVEVDLIYQMMLIYIDHQLALETPIVSGITGAETVPGAYQVWNMERDTKLTGFNQLQESDYETPVDYWIAFDDQAQGIHDASWQGSFGGSVYLNSGSLGCINTPSSVMPQVWELVDIGMPVIVFGNEAIQ